MMLLEWVDFHPLVIITGGDCGDDRCHGVRYCLLTYGLMFPPCQINYSYINYMGDIVSG